MLFLGLIEIIANNGHIDITVVMMFLSLPHKILVQTMFLDRKKIPLQMIFLGVSENLCK